MNFVVYVVAFTLGGYFLDRRRGDGHLFLLIGLALGFTGGIYEVWKLLRILDRESAKRDDQPTDHTP